MLKTQLKPKLTQLTGNFSKELNLMRKIFNKIIFFSQNKVEYERKVREQALRFRDPAL